jgi:uncharacterized protein (TIGR02594 family)
MASGGSNSSRSYAIEDDAPSYLKKAIKDIGIREKLPNGQSNPAVEKFIVDVIGKRMNAISTPWCAFWVGSKLQDAGFISTKSGMARSYLKYGTEVEEPQQGDIVVLWRGRYDDGITGHVGFFIQDQGNSVIILGGNQGDTVSFQSFNKNRILKFVRPRSLSSSRTIRSTVGVAITESSKEIVNQLPSVEVLEKTKETLDQSSDMLSILSSWKPEIKLFLTVLSFVLLVSILYYRIQDGKKLGRV